MPDEPPKLSPKRAEFLAELRKYWPMGATIPAIREGFGKRFNPIPYLLTHGRVEGFERGGIQFFRYVPGEDETMPCPSCGSGIAPGANVHTCDKCGKYCCTACTDDVKGPPGKADLIYCDECLAA